MRRAGPQPPRVPVVRYYALHVLDYRGCEISGLLSQIPLDVTLADDGAERLIAEGGPAWELWQLLHNIKPRPQDRNRLGKVAAGKLLARKRPRLIPVYDSYVEKVLSRTRTHGTWWHDLRCQLTQDAALVSELQTVRTRARAGDLSLLRTLDIMCWMFAGSPEEAKPDRQASNATAGLA